MEQNKTHYRLLFQIHFFDESFESTMLMNQQFLKTGKFENLIMMILKYH